MTVPDRPSRAPRPPALALAIVFALATAAVFSTPVLAATASASAVPVRVDGRLDADEWAGAQRFDDFVVVEPWTRAAPDGSLATEVLLRATPAGIALGFRLAQPAEVPLLAPQVARDVMTTADRINVYIDFDADGRVAYNFTVLASGSIQDNTVTNETLFSPDFDGDWQHAALVGDGGWSAEILIPWTITAMRGADAPTRTIGLHLDRVVASRSERHGWPATSFLRGRFVSEFARVEIPQYPASLLHVWPYATVIHDQIDGDMRWKTGADLFWKPSAGFQLSAALNPDFGQVEADDLVVNFEAVEVFFSDRRPFFTENQAFFDLRTPDNGQLVYTRRVGGPADDGSGVSDIDIALKANGSWGGLGYGLFGASEDGDAGRDSAVGRLLWEASPQLGVGWLGTHVERPFLDRTATVQATDLRWQAGPSLLVNAQLLGSWVEQRGIERQGQGGWLRANWNPSPAWRYEVEATHFGRSLDVNDMGFLRRSSLNELELLGEYTHVLAGSDGPIASTRWYAELQARRSDAGVRLPTWLVLEASATLRDGSVVEVGLLPRSDGFDDLVSRGNGLLRRSSRAEGFIAWIPNRDGPLGWDFHVVARPEGLSRAVAVEADLQLYWFPTDAFNLTAEIEPMWSPDWLIWKEGTRFARHSRRLDAANIGMNWFPAPKHELRLKAEWLAIRAREGRRYRLGADAIARPVDGAEPDFAINNFGVQVRYRWEFAAQSDFFLVWSRGGFLREERDGDSTLDLLDEALALRDADQFLAKLRYRF
jgi:hypothetical protein